MPHDNMLWFSDKKYLEFHPLMPAERPIVLTHVGTIYDGDSHRVFFLAKSATPMTKPIIRYAIGQEHPAVECYPTWFNLNPWGADAYDKWDADYEPPRITFVTGASRTEAIVQFVVSIKA